MTAFKIIYLVMTLLVTFGVVRALTENWKMYHNSQRRYMVGFLIILLGMTQGAAAQITNDAPFTYRTGLLILGLAIVLWGMFYGRDPRLRERPWQEVMRDQEDSDHYQDLIMLFEITDRIAEINQEASS